MGWGEVGWGGVGVLAGLPVPPQSWDYLLLQSTVAQQKQREQQNYTHHPAQQALPPLQLDLAEARASALPYHGQRLELCMRVKAAPLNRQRGG